MLTTPALGHQLRVDYKDTRAWFIFGLGGLAAFVAHYCTFYALSLGMVVIVTPLVALNPFFALLLTLIFLRKVERITWKIILGAVLIVGSAAALAIVSHG